VAAGIAASTWGINMKYLFKLIAVLVVLVVVALVAVVYYIDAIAKRGVEAGATFALGVPTTLETADVGILSGEFSMSGLTVSNPPGFDAPHFLRLNDGGVAVSLGSLREDTVELPHLTLSGIDVNLQKKPDGSNFQAILANLKRFEGDGSKPADDAGGKKFVIRKVEVKDIHVHADVVPIGGSLTRVDVPIESIVLNDVGSGGSGVNMSELANVLFKAIFAAVLQKGGGILPADMLKDLGGGLEQLKGLGDLNVQVAGQALQDFGKSLGGAGEGVGQAVENVGKSIGEGAEKALEGVGDLFGGGKKND
jgi:hypothetical protein